MTAVEEGGPTSQSEPCSVCLWDIYRFSYSLGLRLMSWRHAKAVGRLLMEPCTYWRNVEIPAVINQLAVRPGERILDVGSPKIASLYLWYRRGATVFATDLYPYFFEEYSEHLKRLGSSPWGGEYQMELQDARSLTYPDAFFHKAYAISVLEHIEEDGDSRAIREIARVLKPGGVLCFTVPFAARYRESTITQELYFKKPVAGEPVFYQRHYDPEALQERLLTPSGLRTGAIEYYGERWFAYERFYQWLPRLMKFAFSPMSPLFSKILLHRLNERSRSAGETVLVVLQKSGKAPG